MPRPARPDPAPSPNEGFSLLHGVPDNAQALAVRKMLAERASPVLYITHHDRHLSRFVAAAPFFLPKNIPVLSLPAWDTLPYDRAAPNRSLVAARSATLSELVRLEKRKVPYVLATSASAFLQKLPPKAVFADSGFSLKAGESFAHDELIFFLSEQGYRRAGRVMEAGEFAVRGNLIDLFPASSMQPYRIDLFGDVIETIKPFEVLSQRTSAEVQRELVICPTSEILLNAERTERFRTSYRALFGSPAREDTLYHTVSEGQYHAGMEHWLPLFYASVEALSDYMPSAQIVMDHGVPGSLHEREHVITDYYEARKSAELASPKSKAAGAAPYHPLPPEQFFLIHQWKALLAARKAVALEAFDGTPSLHFRAARKLHIAAKTGNVSPLSLVAGEASTASHPVVMAATTPGSAERLSHLAAQQHLPKPVTVTHYDDLVHASKGLFLATVPITSGFQSEKLTVYTEEDIFGRRIIQPRKRKTPSEAFMAEAAAFEGGELLVHKDHGIGRFDGLVTVEALGKKHDCLKIVYRDEDRLFLPVENLELVTRHGGSAGDVELDKLGGSGWLMRKAAYKEKLRMTAEALLKTAAARELSHASPLSAQEVHYANFAGRFPYHETEDQQQAIDEVLEDLARTRPMDRLICGDVGFGKTEVAIRAAFAAASDTTSPVQVALIAPTTLLVRQHYHNLRERFEGTGLRVAQLSRLCTAKEAKETKEGLADGSVDIVIGTHALLAASVSFKRLGLLVIDEEQRFGVKQKEALKALKADIHVLTMSATPIPRTLQMALTGVRELSLITTPPVDRLAIRSFVSPYDPLVIREAIMREIHRGGQVFYVTPRIADLAELTARIRELVPDARLGVAHGQMSATELDRTMNEMVDGNYDVLLSTAIIESGIDIPTANTMIINRADRFGLAQLYQLRGRVGRGKVRAYAYFTLPYHGAMTKDAIKRLEVMQTLDTLGAGFTLASHDMDIRGFGNLVGEEQSGHVKDIGIELYQQMLAEAVKNAKAAVSEAPAAEEIEFSPQLNLGLSIFIPESYVEDESLRLSLYRRAASLQTLEEIDGFAAELADRFGALPEEVTHLFTTLSLKQACRTAGIARIDSGPKGAVFTFQEVRSPEALLGYIAKNGKRMKLRPDQTVFVSAEWKDDADKLGDISHLVGRFGTLLA